MSSSTDFAIGNYVKWKDLEDEWVRGIVTAVTDAGLTVKANGATATEDILKTAAKLSRYGGIKGEWQNNLIEIAENVAIHSIFQRFMYKNNMMGPESVSFAIGDALHELFLKDTVAPFAQMLQSPYIEAGADSKSIVNMKDFVNDPLRKLPFTILWAQIVQRMMFKKPFKHNFFKNLISQYVALAGTNVIDRQVRQKKTESYRYP